MIHKLLCRCWLWWMNRTIERCIYLSAGRHTLSWDEKFTGMLKDRDAFALRHGLRPHPNTPDDVWERMKLKLEKPMTDLIAGIQRILFDHGLSLKIYRVGENVLAVADNPEGYDAFGSGPSVEAALTKLLIKIEGNKP